MNDDDAEKQKRRQSKRLSILPVPGAAKQDEEDVEEGLQDHLNNAAPQVPIMANFEEWMKMVNDNKINAQNSWNFALIDYFHDMSLLKEGDGINFQRASVTLDGCMKIYSSRIDSAATETGRLLTGLATKQGREDIGNEEDDGEGGEDGEEGAEKKKKASKPRGITLAKSFEENTAKKLELELSIDPLFKKMCADFDEGGAKGMLMNSLGIDQNGRVVFDGDFDQEIAKGDFSKDIDSEDEDMEDDTNTDKQIQDLGAKFFPDLSILASQSICPSATMIEAALKDPSNMPAGLQVDNEPLNLPEVDYGGDDDVLDDAALENMGFDDLGGDDGPGGEDFEFGYNPMNEQFAQVADEAGPGSISSSDPRYKPTINEGDLLAYFDHTLKKNWAGPEHWKVQKLKGAQKKAAVEEVGEDGEEEEGGEKEPKKKKAPVEVDFLSEDNDIDEAVLFARPAHMSTLALTKAQQRSDTNHLLPNDEHFSTDNLVKMFIKPGKRITGLLFKDRVTLQNQKDADQHFWAQHFNEDLAEYGVQGPDPEPLPETEGGDDFGGFDDYDDYDGGATDMAGPHNVSFLGLPKAHPEYVSYAKVAKRVDVRKLKDNLWRVMDYEKAEEQQQQQEESEDKPKVEEEEKKFTELVQQVGAEYPRHQKEEISTSFVFICLLHLANEKGLSIEQQEDLADLAISKDLNVRVDQLGA